MSKNATTTELRKMSPADLRKEVEEKRAIVAKMRMGVALQAEKDTAKYRREKRMLARLITVLGQVEKSAAKPLKDASKSSTVPASAKATVGKPAPSSK